MRAWLLPLLFILAGAVLLAEAQFFGSRGLGIFGGGLGGRGRPTFDSRGVASNGVTGGLCGECTTFKTCFLCGRSLYVFRIRC